MDKETHRAAVVFSAPLARLLPSEEARLPPTYVGVRKVRASSKFVRDALLYKQHIRKGADDQGAGDGDGHDSAGATSDASSAKRGTSSSLHPSPVVYKVKLEDGTERRMTRKEKKMMKKRLQEERNAAKKRINNGDQTSPTTNKGSFMKSSENWGAEADKSEQPFGKADPAQAQKRKYHQLEVSPEAIEEELAQLRGDRSGVPPVILSAPMSQQAARMGLLKGDNALTEIAYNDRNIMVDDDLALLWAGAIKDGMSEAEEARSKEEMRPMAYQIVPEVWSRLRPQTLSQRCSGAGDFNCGEGGGTVTLASSSEPVVPRAKPKSSVDSQCCASEGMAEIPSTSLTAGLTDEECQLWSSVKIRHPFPGFDDDLSIVYECIYRHSNLHISCGAKFGCNFLIYDGQREDRHAFAGLRVFSGSSKWGGMPMGEMKELLGPDGAVVPLTIPSAYDLAGFVRGLNTAGKLALLATVIHSNEQEKGKARVAFVDLALEKILSAPTHQRKPSSRSKEKRKEVGKHLAKKRGC